MKRVLVVTGDLIARARVENAAVAAAVEVAWSEPAAMLEALRDHLPELLILDLDAGRQPVLAGLDVARGEGVVPDRVIGYYSHVDDRLAHEARRGGCEPVPRGRFWRTLPGILAGRED